MWFDTVSVAAVSVMPLAASDGSYGDGGSYLVGATAVEASEAAPAPVAFTARTLNW